MWMSWILVPCTTKKCREVGLKRGHKESVAIVGAFHPRVPDSEVDTSFNGRLRDECLNASWFRNLADADEGS